MTYYQKSIVECLGCSKEEAESIEDIMRYEIFHSTLDWQTKEQFDMAALQGLNILRERQSVLN